MTDIVERLHNLAVHCTILEYDTLADGFQSAYAEIERLRLSLSEALAERDAAFEMSKCECGPDEACRNLVEARATGRREGMESMISWNAKEIERLDEQIAENNAYRIRVGNTAVSMANEYCSLRREVHEQSIAAIRAAMEKAAGDPPVGNKDIVERHGDHH